MLKSNYTGHRKDVEQLKNYFELFNEMSWPRKIIEFGVDKGGSLLFFNDLFAPDLIIGLDRNYPPKEFYDKSESFPIHIMQFDQGDLKSIYAARDKCKKCGEFDLIIDDCSHNGEHMENTLKAFWDLLSEGGTYIIEDWPAEQNSVEFYNKGEEVGFELGAKVIKKSTLIAFIK